MDEFILAYVVTRYIKRISFHLSVCSRSAGRLFCCGKIWVNFVKCIKWFLLQDCHSTQRLRYVLIKSFSSDLFCTSMAWGFSKVHGANIGPTWVLSAPDGPHVGPMNLATRVINPLWHVQKNMPNLPGDWDFLFVCNLVHCNKNYKDQSLFSKQMLFQRSSTESISSGLHVACGDVLLALKQLVSILFLPMNSIVESVLSEQGRVVAKGNPAVDLCIGRRRTLSCWTRCPQGPMVTM